MLQRLLVRNYLLIDEVEIEFGPGLTIITGETGSGKSILLGALGLAMGERAEAGALQDPGKRCVVELEVDIARLALEPWFTLNGIPYEQVAILRRQLDPGGRSRAFVNDTPVRVEQLRELGARLVHVHSQHQTLLLADHRFRTGSLDHMAGQRALAIKYAALHREWTALRKELDTLRAEEARLRSEEDFINFQLQELDSAAPDAEEQANIERDLARAEHAEELQRALLGAGEGLAGEAGVDRSLSAVRQLLVHPARVDGAVAALLARIESAAIELRDIAAEAEQLAGNVSLDPARMELLRERLDLLVRLQQKHRVTSNEELLAVRAGLREKAAAMASSGQRIAELEARELAQREAVLSMAEELSKGRLAAIGPLGDRVSAMLAELGMPKAVFQVDHTRTETPGPLGVDSITLRFSANADRAPAPLEKVASGGELGRVMLVLIAIAADSQDLPTVVFDEVDTGVSGEVANRVGELMARMAGQRQVLAITHLPQIASKADHHLLVSKQEVHAAVRTSISPLTMEQRVEAIAQMLSGRRLTKAALENARVLISGK